MAQVTLPFTLTAGTPENVSQLMSDLNALVAGVNSIDETQLTNGVLQKLGLNNGSQIGRGSVITATQETRANSAYGTLATADQVSNLVLPSAGVIRVLFQATWKETNLNTARAAIFIGANQLKTAAGNAAAAEVSSMNEALLNVAGAPFKPLHTWAGGLTTAVGTTAYSTGDVTTGQALAASTENSIATGTGRPVGGAGGDCVIFAAAGTYTVSVQFKSTDSSTVTVKDRRLYVKAEGF